MAEDKNAATPSSDQTESAKEQEAKDVLKEVSCMIVVCMSSQ